MLCGHSPAADLRALTVSDSIQMTVLTDPNVALSELNPADVKVSDDGHWAFIVVKRGNLATGNNDFELLLYDVGQVSRELDKPQLPSARILARFSSSSNRDAITKARWLSDNKTIVFIGEHPGETPQIYHVGTSGGKPRQLTFSPTPIIDYDLNALSNSYVYTAEIPVNWSDRKAHGYEVGVEPIFDTVARGEFSVNSCVQYFIGNKSSKSVTRVNVESGLRRQDVLGMWLSHRGEWAVVLRHVSSAPPSWWQDYVPVAKNEYLKGSNSPDNNWFSIGKPLLFAQFMLVDMKTGSARMLLDAPTGLVFGGPTIRVHWVADDSAIILANTFLPLNSNSATELDERRASPSIVEVERGTGAITRITDVLPQVNGGLPADRQFWNSTYNDHDGLVVTWKSKTGGNIGSIYTGGTYGTIYRRAKGAWQESQQSSNVLTSGIKFSVTQSLNEPPELLATDITTGQAKIISDLNPQLRALNLGHMEQLDWLDESNHKWTGGLLKPTDYKAGKRSPLVLLTHGFDSSQFYLDGPFGSAAGYAARVLANRGIMVLQVNDLVGQLGNREELERQVQGYRAAIQQLDRMKLIDPARVGIHGWSRTGYYVQHALVFSGIPFAAASVSAPSELGAMTHAMFFGMPYPGMVENERMLGVPLWGDENAKLWAERDPTFHLDRVHTPLRIEVYQEGLVWWDTYANLRRHQKPVEYWFFPDAAHILFKPWERLTSQEAAVDWYDFWLNGREDPAIAKTEQYVRWRALRKLHEADSTEHVDVAPRP
jgi:dipeptidyl aminopeptidase/acylaminoacyl peptidase